MGSQGKLLVAGRVLTAAALGVMAGLHLHLYETYGYKAIPTIGDLFLANVIAGSLLCAAMLAVPVRILAVTALASSLLLDGTFIGFLVALEQPLFGFQDSFQSPHAWPALIVEIAGSIIATATAALCLRRYGMTALAVWRRA